VVHGLTFKGGFMKKSYLIIVDPRKGQSLADCLLEKGLNFPSKIYCSKQRIETERATFHLRNFKNLNPDSLRGFRLDMVAACESLKGSIYEELTKQISFCMHRDCTTKEIVYI
tara:strand:+ start:165 stop:503 length:339 start_codon:yes stop_codon:yes gene_type:complete